MSISKIINPLIGNLKGIPPWNEWEGFDRDSNKDSLVCRQLNYAFIVSLGKKESPGYKDAIDYLKSMDRHTTYGPLARFLNKGKDLIREEINDRRRNDSDFEKRFSSLEEYLETKPDFSSTQTIDRYWSVFFPEAEGVFSEKELRSEKLRKKRIVKITDKNPAPITDPGKQIIFTSNILLTIPDKNSDPDSFGYSEELMAGIKLALEEEQTYFYDHPVQIGTQPESNEIIYGLKGLNEAAAWEKKNGNMDSGQKLTCILSASVTHKPLQKIAKIYVSEEIQKYGNFEHLDVYVFTEEDTNSIVEVLASAGASLEGSLQVKESDHNYKKLSKDQIREYLLDIFGVDGEYGRHYSFLKAIAAFWQLFIDKEKKATFKIDLDQVFPQRELKNETGKSAFEHFKTSLWGAEGIDSDGNGVELGMIAGALVNEKDIHKGIFTPDVVFDSRRDLGLEERFFYSKLMMGLSTSAELGTRYGNGEIDGKSKCIQRIHVTGGTNGILVSALRRHRPFTPGFIGRAEDQAYILSTMGTRGTGLAYLHKDGLIMRHDKEAFASQAIKAASTGNMAGDLIRTLYFSRYGEILSPDIQEIKRTIDPFTGCFVSKIPITIVYLRYCMKAADLFAEGREDVAADFMLKSFSRLESAIDFAYGKENKLQKVYEKEKTGWDIYYDILEGIEEIKKTPAINKMSLQIKAAGICAGSKL